MSKRTAKEYTVKKAMPHRGRIVPPGERISLHPREAQYLIGSHLERPGAAKTAAKGKGGAKTEAKTEAKTDGGNN